MTVAQSPLSHQSVAILDLDKLGGQSCDCQSGIEAWRAAERYLDQPIEEACDDSAGIAAIDRVGESPESPGENNVLFHARVTLSESNRSASPGDRR